MKCHKTSISALVAGLVLALFAAAACHHHDHDERPVRKHKRTILMYIAAENSLNSFAADDSLEVAAALPDLPDSVQVALYIDNAAGSNLYYGSASRQLTLAKAYKRNVCSTDSAEMDMILSDVESLFQAEHYGIIFWSHASGWVPQASKVPVRRTFGIDNGRRSGSSDSGPQMAITTLANVLQRHAHTDFLFFDACFMQCIEVAYQLRHVTDYVIGSPAEIPADGAPYTTVLPLLARGDIDGAMRSYYDYYASGSGHNIYGGAILSAARTDKLEALAGATRPLIEELFADRAEVATDDVQYFYPVSGSTTFTQYFDIANLFYNRCTAESYAAWWQAFEAAVPVRYISHLWVSASAAWFQVVQDAEHCGAVSVFVPSTFYDDNGWTQAYHTLDWYTDSGLYNTRW